MIIPKHLEFYGNIVEMMPALVNNGDINEFNGDNVTSSFNIKAKNNKINFKINFDLNGFKTAL